MFENIARDPAGHAFALVLIAAHAMAMRSLQKSKKARLLFIGQGSPRRAPGEMPIRVPFTHLAWTAATTIAFALSQETYADEYTSNVDRFRSYFKMGYGPHLRVMGVSVNSPMRYAAIVCFKITSGLLASVVDSVYLPFYFELMGAQNGECDPKHARAIAAGHALFGVSTWVQRVSTIITTFTQSDIALLGHAVVGFFNYTVALDILTRVSPKGEHKDDDVAASV